MGERAVDDAAHAIGVVRRCDPIERDERGVDVRRRPEDRPRHRVEPGATRVQPNQHRYRAVRLRAGLGEEPVGDLALHHHAPGLERRDAVSVSATSGVATLYGRLATSFRGSGSSAARSSARASPKTSVDVVAVAERRHGAAASSVRSISIGVDVPDAVGEERRQHTEARADLEDDVVLLEPGEALDDAEHVSVDEEVLPERLLRRDPAHGVEPERR